MEWGSTSKVLEYIFTCGHWIGRPYRWDPFTRRLVDVSTKPEKIIWMSGVIVTTILRLSIAVSVLSEVYRNELNPSQLTAIFKVILIIIYSLSLLFDWHTVWRRRDLRILLNSAISFMEIFIDKYARRDIQHKKNWTPFILGLLISLLVVASSGIPLLYLPHCDFHLWAPIFPICSKNEVVLFGVFHSRHSSLSLVPLLALADFIFILHTTATAFIYISIGVIFAYLGVDIFKELRNVEDDSSATLPRLKTHKNWTHMYCCFQVFATVADECLFNFLLPGFFGITIPLNSILLYFLITNGVKLILVSICCVSLQTVILSAYIGIFGRVALYDGVSYQISKSWCLKCVSKYRRSHLKSLSRVRFRFGVFSELEKDTIIVILQIIVERTIDLLILQQH